MKLIKSGELNVKQLAFYCTEIYIDKTNVWVKIPFNAIANAEEVAYKIVREKP